MLQLMSPGKKLSFFVFLDGIIPKLKVLIFTENINDILVEAFACHALPWTAIMEMAPGFHTWGTRDEGLTLSCSSSKFRVSAGHCSQQNQSHRQSTSNIFSQPLSSAPYALMGIPNDQDTVLPSGTVILTVGLEFSPKAYNVPGINNGNMHVITEIHVYTVGCSNQMHFLHFFPD
jgi:hypothetical protein